MATGTWQVYGLGLKSILNKEADLNANSNLYMMFTSVTHTPNVDTHNFENALTNIVSGTGLSAAGIAITGSLLTYNTGTNTLMFDIDDISASTVTATGIRNAHIVDKTPASTAANPLIAYCTFDADLSPSAGTLSITINAAGVFTITV